MKTYFLRRNLGRSELVVSVAWRAFCQSRQTAFSMRGPKEAKEEEPGGLQRPNPWVVFLFLKTNPKKKGTLKTGRLSAKPTSQMGGFCLCRQNQANPRWVVSVPSSPNGVVKTNPKKRELRPVPSNLLMGLEPFCSLVARVLQISALKSPKHLGLARFGG